MSKKPVPSKKQAVSSTRSRYSTYVRNQREKLQKALVLEKCPETGETKLRHFASPAGNYRGRSIAKKTAQKPLIQEIKA